MESTKILSFEEFVSQAGAPEEMPMGQTVELPTAGEETPAPAEMPTGNEPEHNLSINLMGDEAPAETDLDKENPEAKVDVEEPAEEVDAHVEDSE